MPVKYRWRQCGAEEQQINLASRDLRSSSGFTTGWLRTPTLCWPHLTKDNITYTLGILPDNLFH